MDFSTDDVYEAVNDLLPALRVKYAEVEHESNLVSMVFRLGAGGWINFRFEVKGDVTLAAYLALLQRDHGPELATLTDVINMGMMIDPERCARITWLATLWSQFLTIGSSVEILSELSKAALILHAKVGDFGLLDLTLTDHDLILGSFIRSGLLRLDAEARGQTQSEILVSLLIDDEARRTRLVTLSNL